MYIRAVHVIIHARICYNRRPVLVICGSSASTSSSFGMLNIAEKMQTGTMYLATLAQGLAPLHLLWYSTGRHTAR